MADICSLCSSNPEEEYYDIDVRDIAENLKKGYSQNVLCEDCNLRAVYKDEEGRTYLGYLIDDEIEFKEIKLADIPQAKFVRFLGFKLWRN